jgi:hypothetical protein
MTSGQQADSFLQYLRKHSKRINCVDLKGSRWCTGGVDCYKYAVTLRELPSRLRLRILLLDSVRLQLQPGRWGDMSKGLLGGAGIAGLKKLQLWDCGLSDVGTAEDLAAALVKLPAGLEHLSIRRVNGRNSYGENVAFPMCVLERLQALTHFKCVSSKLELSDLEVMEPDMPDLALQPLQALTRLADLRLLCVEGGPLTASMLSGMTSLTRLEVTGDLFASRVGGIDLMEPEADVLNGKTQLQHLSFTECDLYGRKAAALLSHLQHMQPLTHLELCNSLRLDAKSGLAALTASSKLQHLDLSKCTLPAGAWQYVFPAGRQLPQLQSLKVCDIKQPTGTPAPTPSGTRLVSCCPALQSLNMAGLKYSTELLAPLQGLTALRTLDMPNPIKASEDLDGLCPLTGLRELSVVGKRLLLPCVVPAVFCRAMQAQSTFTWFQ